MSLGRGIERIVRRSTWVVAATLLVAADAGAQARLASSGPPPRAAVVSAPAAPQSAVRHDSVLVLPDSVDTDAADSSFDDALGPGSGIVAVDRFGHELQQIPAALRRPEDAAAYAKTGSVARAVTPAVITPPPSTTPSSP